MGFENSVAIAQSEDGVVLEIHSEESSVLIGKHGQTLDALEYVLNLIVAREEESATRIHLDSEDYRAKRRRSLEEMAQRMAEQVKKRGRPVTLDPLSPRDRRTIHLALQGEPDLTTRSTGEGIYRQLMILPKGEPGRGRSGER
jgi:spoIIIJ-associated protein